MSFAYCGHCSEGNVLPGEPKGEMRDGAYFAAGSTDASTQAVVLLTDIFGLPLVNSRLIADQLAQKLGCDVWVPDQFNGRPLVTLTELVDAVPQRPGDKISIFKKLGYILTVLTRLPSLYNIRASAVDERIHTFIRKMKEDKKYTKIGVVGYCFGGTTSVRLGSTDLINSAVVAHPGKITKEQVAAIKVPTSWLCAEEDFSFGPELRNEVEVIFATRKDKADSVDYEFHDYKGTVHGFASRPNLGIPEAKEGFEKVFDATVEWFKKTIL